MMKSDISRQYKYVKIDSYFFCLQQNPAVFAWILFFKRNDLITIQPWLKKYFSRWTRSYYRYQWKIFKQNLINLIIFVQCKLGLRKNLETVHLPVYGHFGMYVHKGYKIFNLHTCMVTKIFDSDVNQSSILNEIEKLKKVSQIDFAPTLTKWDIDNKLYQEDYIKSNIAAAHRSADSVTFLKAFYQEVVPCMNSLILFQRPVSENLSMYLKELIGTLESSKLLTEKLDSEEARIFNIFIHSTVEQINDEGNRSVYLVLTHGDFCPANLLNAKSGLRVVDWEGIENRSLLFDFYSYFFYRPVSPKLPVDQMASEINEALPYFISKLSLRVPDITENLLASVKAYRLLYYIERIYMLVERDSTDSQLNMKDYIFRYIEAYSHYEEMLNSDVTAFHNGTVTEI